MLKSLNFSLKKTVKMPPADTQDFKELNVAELGQWIVLAPDELVTSQIDNIKDHPDFNEALQIIPEAKLNETLRSFHEDDLINLLNSADLDETTFYLEVLGDEKTEYLLPKLSRKLKLNQYLAYAKDSCGRVMQTDFFTLPIDFSASEALNHIREKAGETPIYYLYCLTPKKKLIGVVSLRELALTKPNTPLDDLVNREVLSASPNDPIEEAIKIVQQENFVALPVVNHKNRMIGLIQVDDIVDEIQDQATADIYAQAGLQEMDSVAMKAHLSYLNRVPWLIFNLFLAWIASLVISMFERTISEYTLLAILMPIAAALGGNTAVQTLTVVTRGMATGDFNYVSYSQAIIKEIIVGFSLGLTTGTVAFLMVYIWKQDITVGLVLALSMGVNSFVAAALGATIPILFKSMGRDPAVSSSVLVITLTDIFCFFSFLGLATIGLRVFS